MIAAAPALDPALYRDLVGRALAEDVGRGDITTSATVEPALRGQGVLLAKSCLVVAGLPVAVEVFRQLEPDVIAVLHHGEGTACGPGTELAAVRGRAAALLTAERTALNLLQRLSGIATLTRRLVDAAAGRITILDTRKTTPTLRVLEKYAVRVGGGTNHRMALDDGILIKDNHVRLCGGIRPAVERMRAAGHRLPIEVEAGTIAEVEEALAAGADRVLVDNMTTDAIREAVRLSHGRAAIEISGGVTETRIPELASTGAEYVSVGALTHSAPAADISFELEPA